MIRITLIAVAALATIATVELRLWPRPARRSARLSPSATADGFDSLDRGTEGRALCRQELRRQAAQARLRRCRAARLVKRLEFTLPQCGKRSKTTSKVEIPRYPCGTMQRPFTGRCRIPI